MSYNATDLKKGLKILWESVPFEVTDFQFVKPGKGMAMYKCRLKNMLTGATQDKTFREVDRMDKPDLESRELAYSYDSGDHVIFSDPETFEEVTITTEVLGRNHLLLSDNMHVDILFFNGKAVEVTLPIFIEKQITETEPGYKGNTATNTYKPAKVQGGYEIRVPLFIEQGDWVKIDTRTGEYSERISKR